MSDLQPLTANFPSDTRHGFFTRDGGVSTGIYASLNVGLGSADEREDILENRRRVCEHLQATQFITPHQTHSSDVALINEPPTEPIKADALITEQRGLAIGVLAADCVPILLADKSAQWCAAIHAGWKGARAGIVQNTLAQLAALGAQPADIVAAIGASISAANYEVGAEFADYFPAAYLAASTAKPDHYQFDLPAYVAAIFAKAGVAAQRIEICTYATPDRFFSHRRATHNGEPDYGRHCAAVVLN